MDENLVFTYPARARIPLLKDFGLATRHFPHYVNRKISLHGVDCVLLSFIMRGRALHYVDDLRYEEEGPSLSVIHFGKRHSIVTGAEGVEVLNIFIDPRIYPLPLLPEPLDKALVSFLPLHPGFQNKLNRIVHVKFEDGERSLVVARLLHAEFEGAAAGFRCAVDALFRTLLILACRSVLRQGLALAAAPSQAMDSPAERARLYLENNYRRKFALAKIADVAGVSPNYLCRLFKKHTGKTLFEYVLDKRLQLAMYRLRFTRDKIVAVAFDAGFDDISFFNRNFKKVVRRSPGQYRNESNLLEVPCVRRPGRL